MKITAQAKIKRTRSPKSLPESIHKFLEENKADKIVIIDLEGKSSLADHLVIANGISQRHIKVLSEKVKEYLHKRGISDIHIEGAAQCDWVLVDGGDVIIHIFRPEVCSFYNLEKMWGVDFEQESMERA